MQPDFLTSLETWKHRPAALFPPEFAPCNEVGIPDIDKKLATIFQRLCKVEVCDEDRLNYLGDLRTEWRVKIARWHEDHPDVDLSPAEKLVDVLNCWFRQLHAEPWNGREAA